MERTVASSNGVLQSALGANLLNEKIIFKIISDFVVLFFMLVNLDMKGYLRIFLS